ncbi:LysR family transcriptional regulator [Bradyrhizobium sp. 180]|uniref:LysR family transcriptional regulator n=1 Tax=Bradyrhizobium sp. 180 TaxID=2782650 RepID=UPI001FF785E6|nr:LysR family transcriptional regulator [Bradyrhizobium sp. 180]MCK1492156.1 LysR family transcriptional regulator [Bradyrhizobium sp. 180]
MNVGLRQLRAFLAVAKHGSFSRAAKEVSVSQSAVSFSVQQLERELDLRLLDRTTRQVRLTAVGEVLAASGTRLLGELDALLRELKDTGERRRGKVTLACVPSVARGLMPACVAHCTKKWPEISFSIEDIAAKEVVARVTRGDVEFGLSGGEIEATELHIESLTQDPFVLACRRDNALARSKAVAWAKLSDHRLVMLNNTSGSRPQILNTLANAGVRVQIALELAQPSSVLAMVEAGLGIAVIPTLVAPIKSHPELTTRRLIRPSVSRTIFLVRRRDRSLSPAASAVWTALLELFGSAERRLKA